LYPLLVSWQLGEVVHQVAVTVGLDPLGFVSFAESLATPCDYEPSLIV